MKGSDINPLALFAEGKPRVSTKRRIVFQDPKGCKSKYVALNPKRKKVCEIVIDGGLLKDKNPELHPGDKKPRLSLSFGLLVPKSNQNRFF